MQIVFSHCQVGISQRRGIWHQATQVMPRSGYIGSSKLLIVQSVSAGISVKDRSNNASTCAYRLGTFCFKQLHRFCPKKRHTLATPTEGVGRGCSLFFQSSTFNFQGVLWGRFRPAAQLSCSPLICTWTMAAEPLSRSPRFLGYFLLWILPVTL